MSSRFKRIAIVGSGAIGCYYGARLQRAGAEVNFLMRSDLAAVREKGLCIRLPDSEIALPEVRAFATPQEIGPVDLVIIGLKTTADGEFEALVRPLLGQETAVLTLQNGLGSDARLASLFGAERVLGGLCFICVNRLAPGLVHCLQPGSLSLGEFGRPVGERLRDLAALFTTAGVRTNTGDSLEELRWRKLVWNVPFNGLSIALGGLTTDKILATADNELRVRALMAEVIAIAAALGHVIPASFADKQVELTKPMGPYRPSSLIDYLDGREVEVESIWGEPLRTAERLGVSAPELERLFCEIQGRVENRRFS